MHNITEMRKLELRPVPCISRTVGEMKCGGLAADGCLGMKDVPDLTSPKTSSDSKFLQGAIYLLFHGLFSAYDCFSLCRIQLYHQ